MRSLTPKLRFLHRNNHFFDEKKPKKMGKNGNFKEIFGILKLEPKWCTGAKFQVKQPKDVARISGTNKQTDI